MYIDNPRGTTKKEGKESEGGKEDGKMIDAYIYKYGQKFNSYTIEY